MKWRGCRSVPVLNYNRFYNQRRFHFTTFLRKGQGAQPRASAAGSNGSSSQGNSFLVPGATVATILMLGALHARRLYDDKKIEEARAKGVEFEFHPDVKARFLRLLPLRSISRFWGSLTGMELPVWLRPHVYKAWARAFHSNLEEAQLPLEEYASLRDFFVRRLKEGLRPIDSDSCCLVSPVDGTVMRFGELRGPGAMIEQVKGCSYSASSLLGANSFLPMIAAGEANEERGGEENTVADATQKSWWRISFASPKVRDTESSRPLKGLFYCVIYLKPGDYHRIHSPVDWNVFLRRHFTGHLFPMNERATRTIRNLYVENERVVLEGQWQEGYMAMAAIGATNIGSIELFVEPTLRTNNPQKKLLQSEPPEERVYEPEGTGVLLKKGDEIAAFNMGSTVVLVFQAPISESSAHQGRSSEFRFCIKRGDRIRMGEALGRWKDS
ncbi:Phosphatidylserine decarboxylase proenzyme 1, mitochondrial [Sesamum angolense]|uniref:Phosphatidylserine decarboxylase proenzyme 1, mitochondrial n=1 Tax=Sesamum angolense TaxID=2727404 RepID=A0AAE2BL88_9LAMI|nr:Phosphatidylserine decarboxylase proenzyme 1, mitochondrial [Sesamum angolense]